MDGGRYKYIKDNKCRNQADCKHRHYYTNTIIGKDTPEVNKRVYLLTKEYEQSMQGKVLIRCSVLTAMKIEDLIRTLLKLDKKKVIPS